MQIIPFQIEAEMGSYFRVPRAILFAAELNAVSFEAKMLYSYMLDRMFLSAERGFYDSRGQVYIYFCIDQVQRLVGCGRAKAIKLMRELDTENGVGLIRRVKQGQGKPARIYVRQIVDNYVENPVEKMLETDFWDFPCMESGTLAGRKAYS